MDAELLEQPITLRKKADEPIGNGSQLLGDISRVAIAAARFDLRPEIAPDVCATAGNSAGPSLLEPFEWFRSCVSDQPFEVVLDLHPLDRKLAPVHPTHGGLGASPDSPDACDWREQAFVDEQGDSQAPVRIQPRRITRLNCALRGPVKPRSLAGMKHRPQQSKLVLRQKSARQLQNDARGAGASRNRQDIGNRGQRRCHQIDLVAIGRLS